MTRIDRKAAQIALLAALSAGMALAARVRVRQAASPARKAQGQAAASPEKAQRKLAAPRRAGSVPPASAKPGRQAFKNLQVLQSFKPQQVLDGMQYLNFALGEQCNFCHNTSDYSNDSDPREKTARQMMKMLFALNKDSFNDRPQVSCYTCHQGRPQPNFVPLPPESENPALPAGPVMARARQIQPRRGTKPPTVDAVLAKYKQAIGAAATAPGSLILKIDRTAGAAQNVFTPEQVYEKAPNKILIVSRGQEGPYSAGFDGTKAWISTESGTKGLSGMDALLLPRAGLLNPAAALDAYTDKRTAAMVQLGLHQAWAVVGKAPDGNLEQFYFDTDTGLLLRRAIVYRTIFGELLYSIYYRDYRKENGFEIPFQTDWWEGNHGWTEIVRSVQANAPIADAQFEPPPPSAKTTQPAKPAQRAKPSPPTKPGKSSPVARH